MDTQEITHFLKDVELFQDLDEDERRLVAEMSENKVFGPKAMLFRENTPRRKIFIIQEGEVQLFKEALGRVRQERLSRRERVDR